MQTEKDNVGSTIINTGIDPLAPFGIQFDRLYQNKYNGNKVYVEGIVMRNGDAYVALSDKTIIKASLFIRKYR